MSYPFKRPPYAETDAVLTSSPTYPVQWMIVRNVVMADPEMSRRKLLDDMSLVFFNAGFSRFPFRDGTYYDLPDIIDEVFGNDCDMRAFSYYLQSDESGKHPRRMSRKPERLRVLNLYLKLKYPRFIPQLER